MLSNSPSNPHIASGNMYQAVTAPRLGVIQRGASASVGSLVGDSGELKRYGSIGSELPNVRGAVQGRERNKKDMQELNEKLAGHIEKSRYLQAQNKKIKDELNNLKNRWGKETEKIRQMYDVELKQLRRLLDDAEREKGEKQSKITSQDAAISELRGQLTDMIDQLDQERDKTERLQQQLSDRDSELGLLRRRLQGLEDDRKRDRKNSTKTKADVARLHSELDTETSKRLLAESEGQTIREELEFLKRIHEQEMKELQILVKSDQDQDRSREFWKNELGQAVHDIQSEYDERVDALRGELERLYMNKLLDLSKNGPQGTTDSQYLRDENKKLKSTVNDIRTKMSEMQAKCDRMEQDTLEMARRAEDDRRRTAEEKESLNRDVANKETDLQRVLSELQSLMDAKLNLESEIVAYRKLLDADSDKRSSIGSGPEVPVPYNRIKPEINNEDAWPPGDVQRVQGDVTASTESFDGDSDYVDTLQNYGSQIRAELTSKTQYDRSYKGTISIDECSTDGKFIQLQNVGNVREQLSQWRIVRNIDNGRSIIRFTISDLQFAPGQSIKIYARGCRPEDASQGDIEMSHTSWGVGNIISTNLYNPDGEEKAYHIQRTVYGSA